MDPAASAAAGAGAGVAADVLTARIDASSTTSAEAGFVHQPHGVGVEQPELGGVDRVTHEVGAERLDDQLRRAATAGLAGYSWLLCDEHALAVGGQPLEELLGQVGVVGVAS